MRTKSLLIPLVLSLFAPQSFAAQLDQSQQSYNGGGYVWVSREIAQTFKPSVSGTLDSVDVYLDWWQGPAYQMTLRMIAAPNQLPDTSQVLASYTIPSPRSGWNSISFRSAGVTLSADESYAMWFTSDDPSGSDPGIGVGVNWSPDVYSRGVALQRSPDTRWGPWSLNNDGSATTDVCFRTYMVVPEPSSGMIVAGLGWIARPRRRKNIG